MTFIGSSITCAPLATTIRSSDGAREGLLPDGGSCSRACHQHGAERGDGTSSSRANGGIDHPRLNAPLPPAPLDRLVAAADLVTGSAPVLQADVAARRSVFARAMVDRVWKNFMGRGLVSGCTTFATPNRRRTRSCSSRALTRDFAGASFDVKQLARTIMRSSTYQLTSNPTATQITAI